MASISCDDFNTVTLPGRGVARNSFPGVRESTILYVGSCVRLYAHVYIIKQNLKILGEGRGGEGGVTTTPPTPGYASSARP